MIAMNENALSPRALNVLTLFNLRSQDVRLPGNPAAPDLPTVQHLAGPLAPGSITLITGPSGAGKTTLLRAAKRILPSPMVDLATIHLPDTRVIDCLDDLSVESALEWLSRFGLGEVWCYLSPASRLSDGERFRLRLAIAVHRATKIVARQGSAGARAGAGAVVLADEFANSLDRITARIVSRNLRRALTGSAVAAILATAHDDLEPALAPDSVIHCDFGAWQCCHPRAE